MNQHQHIQNDSNALLKMDYKHQRKVSLLEGEQFFFNKVLSRDSSVGCSSRILYYRTNAEGVPFKWEMQPGTPKEPPKKEAIPPLSLPPAVLSLGLPKPCIDIEVPPPNKASMLKSKLMFWKKLKKSRGVKKFQTGSKENDVISMEFYSSDGEDFMASPRNSSSTSSSNSSFSSSRVQSPVREKVDELLYGGCSPWHITSALACVGRRI